MSRWDCASCGACHMALSLATLLPAALSAEARGALSLAAAHAFGARSLRQVCLVQDGRASQLNFTEPPLSLLTPAEAALLATECSATSSCSWTFPDAGVPSLEEVQ